MTLLLGIDVSTTATKAILVGGDGAVRGIGTAAYDYDRPRPGLERAGPGPVVGRRHRGHPGGAPGCAGER